MFMLGATAGQKLAQTDHNICEPSIDISDIVEYVYMHRLIIDYEKQA